MELQQQQQQVVQLEGLENATARTLLGKLINILLAVMAVLLVFVSTVANCVVPLMKTRSRTLSTLLLVILLAFLWRNWEAISQYLDRFLLHSRWPARKEISALWRERKDGACRRARRQTHCLSHYKLQTKERNGERKRELTDDFDALFLTQEWICLHFDEDLFFSVYWKKKL